MDTSNPTRATPRLTYTCPHCSGVLDLSPLIPPSPTEASSTTPTLRAPELLDRWEPLVRGLRQLATSRRPLPSLPGGSVGRCRRCSCCSC